MNAETKTPETSARMDLPTLRGIESTAIAKSTGSVFIPSSMGEAMEFARMMSTSNFVPAHLRGKPGDCLAVVLQSVRWEMDSYAVAGKSYFVNDRIAYEAQLVNAVINTRAPLNERPKVEWFGEGPNLSCKVTARIKNDSHDSILEQELNTITTRNSPLWKQSPRVQLGYYTLRAWARLYCPEVLLGVYTRDEMEDMGPGVAQEDGSTVHPPRPTRAQAERLVAENDALERQYRATMSGRVHTDELESHETVDHETGEITGGKPSPEKTDADRAEEARPIQAETAQAMSDAQAASDTQPAAAQSSATQPALQPPTDHAKRAQNLLKKVLNAESPAMIAAIEHDYADAISQMQTESPEHHAKVAKAIADKRAYFAMRK